VAQINVRRPTELSALGHVILLAGCIQSESAMTVFVEVKVGVGGEMWRKRGKITRSRWR
jgi:hypothetical protein